MNKILSLVLIGSCLVVSGCSLPGQTPTGTPTPIVPTETESNEPDFKAAFNSPISGWHEYHVEEMGFSIKVPVETKDTKLIFHDCTQPGDRCDGRTDTYWYEGVLGPIYLGSQSEFYSSGGEAGFEVHDFFVKNGRYFLGTSETPRTSDGPREIHPISVYTVDGEDFVIIDLYQEVDRKKEENYGDGERIIPQRFAALFKLPGSKKFKAAYLSFYEKDITMEQFKKVLETIRFK